MSNLATITNNILADSGIDDINVIVSTGSYSNPAWITALSWTKITGAPANIVTGTGTTNVVPKFTGTSTIGDSAISDTTTEVNITKRVFITSGVNQFVFTPNLGSTSNRIETLGVLPLEITTSGSSIGMNVGGGSSQFSMTNTGASFFIPVTAIGQAATSPAFIANNSTGTSGTAQHYINFTAGTTTIARMLRGNGAAGLVANGLNIDNFDGFQVRLNQLGGSGGSFNITGGNVGIGTTSPTYTLEVNSGAAQYLNARFYSSSHSMLMIESTTAVRQALIVHKTPTREWSTGLDTNGNFIWYDNTASSYRLQITTGGNLLVGTTTDNGARLQTVGGAVSFNNGSAQSSIIGTTFTGFEYTRGSTIFGFIGTENSASGGMRYNSVAGNFEHKFYNNSNLALTIASTGAASFSSSISLGGGSEGLRLGNVGDNSAYDNVKLWYTGFNGGSPRVYLTPRTTPGSGVINTFLHLLNTNGTSSTSNNTMGLIVDGSATANSLLVERSASRNMLGISSISLPTSGAEEGVAVVKTNSNLWQMSLVGYAVDSKGMRVYNTGGAGYTSFEVAQGAGTRFIVDGVGNVGIGTTSPTFKLDVQNNTQAVARVLDTSTNASLILQAGSGSAMKVTAYNYASSTALPLYIQVDGANTIMQSGGGNVLIGTTTDAGYRLNVSGISSSTTGFLLSSGQYTSISGVPYIGIFATEAASSDGFGALLISSRTDVARPIIFGTSNGSVSTERMRITSGGNVGIGTTSPAEKLDVIGGGLAAGNGTIRTGITYSSLGLIGTFTNHDLGILTNGSIKATITSGGNVLIGTTSDNGNRLRVNGNSDFVGTMFVNTPSSGAGVTFRTTGNTNNPGIFFITDESTSKGTILVSGSTGALDMALGAGGTERVFIKGNSGNVLIGTTTDVGARLYVDGAFRTGTLTAGTQTAAVDWRLGNARGGTATANALIRVQINGVLVDLIGNYV